jgi:3-methyladenine DNA glycosylase AlkD
VRHRTDLTKRPRTGRPHRTASAARALDETGPAAYTPPALMRAIGDDVLKRSARVKRSAGTNVEHVLAALRRNATKTHRDGLARFAIPGERALGVSMKDVQALARKIGRDHALALTLWETGWHEARLLVAFVADPARLTPTQMDRWARQFENWAECDTLCFKLFDRSPHAWAKVRQWSRRKDEFVKRAAFALLASLALHDRESGDAPFLAALDLIERAATDDRNFVSKGVNWALRAVGERSAPLNAAAIALARRLADSPDAAARWVGKDALRALTGPAARKRLAMRAKAGTRR